MEKISEDELKNIIAKMTHEEKQELANHMFAPVRCGGCHYDKNGEIIYIHGGKECNAKEHNDIIRQANPTWSEEDLKSHLLDEDE